MNAEPSPTNTYYIRLIGGISLFAGVISSVYAVFLVCYRIPAIETMLQDFDLQLPFFTQALFRAPWFPAAVSIAGIAFAVIALVRSNRAALVLCACFVTLGVTLNFFAEFALQLPLFQLQNNLSGN